MNFIAIGVNYISAQVEFREKLAINKDEQPIAQHSFYKQFQNSCVILSTCNRVEIYTYGKIEADELSEWLAEHCGVNHYELCKHAYVLQNNQVVEHLFRVVCGLDSMVLGENEIFGQTKKAYEIYLKHCQNNKYLNKLFQQAFNVAKYARTATDITKKPISIMSTTLLIIKKYFNSLSDKTLLLVGSGKMIQIGANYLSKQNPKQIIIANRNLAKITNLSTQIQNARTTSLDQIHKELINCDLIITSTDSPNYLIEKKSLLNRLKQNSKTLIAIDLSVPRDIEINDELKNYPNFHYYHIDDLKEVIGEHQNLRNQSAEKIEAIICQKVAEFINWLDQLQIEKTLKEFRNKQQKLSESLLIEAKNELKKGRDVKEVLEKFAHQLSQKLMHTPLKNAKDLATDKKKVKLMRNLFTYD